MFEKGIALNFIKKNITAILISLFLFIALVIYAVTQLSVGLADQIIVLVDGQEYGVYSLHDTREIRIESQQGYNLLVIKDGQAYVTEADCDNQVCVHTQPVTKSGGQIICLPHRVVIRLQIIEKSEIDAVTN